MRKETEMIIEAINKVGSRLSEVGKTVVQVEDTFILIDATDYRSIRYEFVGFIGAKLENYVSTTVPFDGVTEVKKDGVKVQAGKEFGHNVVFSLIKNKVNELLDEDVITANEGREIVEKYKKILQNDYLVERFGKRDE